MGIKLAFKSLILCIEDELNSFVSFCSEQTYLQNAFSLKSRKVSNNIFFIKQWLVRALKCDKDDV